MEYPKKIMSTPELIQMGFPRRYLERAYHSKLNTFATNEQWRQKEIAIQKGSY